MEFQFLYQDRDKMKKTTKKNKHEVAKGSLEELV